MALLFWAIRRGEIRGADHLVKLTRGNLGPKFTEPAPCASSGEAPPVSEDVPNLDAAAASTTSAAVQAANESGMADLRKSCGNTLLTCIALLSDHDLFVKVCITRELTNCLAKEHGALVKTLKDADSVIKFCAEMAAGAWIRVLHELVSVLQRSESLARMHFTLRLSALSDQALSTSSPDVVVEDGASRVAMRLLLCFLKARLVSQLCLSRSLPFRVAAVLQEDPQVRRSTVQWWKNQHECFVAAQRRQEPLVRDLVHRHPLSCMPVHVLTALACTSHWQATSELQQYIADAFSALGKQNSRGQQ